MWGAVGKVLSEPCKGCWMLRVRCASLSLDSECRREAGCRCGGCRDRKLLGETRITKGARRDRPVG